MKKLPLFKGLNIVLLTAISTINTIKPVLALDYNFFFGSNSGTITSLVDNATTVPPSIEVTGGTNTGTYVFAGGDAFTLNAGNIVVGSPATDVWQGLNGGVLLRFTITPTLTLGTINGSTPAPVIFTSVPVSTPTLSIPFNFNTTPGLIVLGGISGIAHLCRKLKEKKQQNEEQKLQKGD